MLKVALFVLLEAKAGKEKELEAFLKKGFELALREETTPLWSALRLGERTFAIFDAFQDEAGRQKHLHGPIASALMLHTAELLAQPPSIQHLNVLCAKLPAVSG